MKQNVKKVLVEALALLSEFNNPASMTGAPQQQGAPTPLPAPTNQVQPPPSPGQAPASGQGQDPQTVETLVDQINNIRAGKSFAEPAIYKALSDYYDTLDPQTKTMLQQVMEGIVGVLSAGSSSQDPNSNNTRTGQPPVAPPAGTPNGAGPTSGGMMGGGGAPASAPVAAI